LIEFSTFCHRSAERDVSDPHLALVLFGVDAAQAVVFEKGAVLGVESGLRRLGEEELKEAQCSSGAFLGWSKIWGKI